MPSYDRYSPSQRLRRRLLVYALPAVLVGAALAFFAGYRLASAPRAKGKKAAATDVTVETAALAKALDAVDQAVTARFEKRPEDSLAALRIARDAYASLPAIDLMLAATALDSGDSSAFSRAVRTAQKHPSQAARADLLLGIRDWLYPGANDQNDKEGMESALSHFAEASAHDRFHGDVCFFQGEVLRRLGRPQEGYEAALRSVFRLNPWDSSLVVSVKTALAAQQAHITNSLPPLDSAQRSATALAQAASDGVDPAAAAVDLRRVLPAVQAGLLASDIAFAAQPAIVAALSQKGPLPVFPRSEESAASNTKSAP